MRNNQIIVAALVVSFAMMLAACGQVTTKIQVVDEQGDPVEGAEVKLWYVNYRDEKMKVIKTDAKGRIEDTGNPELRINLSVAKEGYYKTFYDQSEGTSLSKDINHDLEVILRKVINPIPMYAKKINIRLPKIGEKFAFDFQVGDWVAPHGKGAISDIYFKSSKVVIDRNNYRCETFISFPENSIDGILEDARWSKCSEFKSSRYAAEESYKPQEKIIDLQDPVTGYEGETPNKNYLLTLRSRIDTSGNKILANYAKIIGGINVWVGTWEGFVDKPPAISFTYYFNPNVNDRNLEFDPERNLFKNLTLDEQVTKP